MRRIFTTKTGCSIGLATGLVFGLAGCAASPESLKNDAYDAYWQCTSQAVRPYVRDLSLPARQAALRAQAHCNASYGRLRQAQVNLVQSKVARDSSDLADQLGGQQALIWRQRVTQRLADYVSDVRRRGV